MSLFKIILPIAVIGLAYTAARPIIVNQPSAITTPISQSHPTDFGQFQYAATAPSTVRYIQSPLDYVPTDSAYIRSTNPRLRPQPDTPVAQTTAPNTRPYPKQIEGYDFYFPQSEDFTPTDMFDPNLSYLRDLQPPVRSEEPNYYAVLKMKKGSKKYNPNLKQVNLNGEGSPVKATVTQVSQYSNDDYLPMEYNQANVAYPLAGQESYQQQLVQHAPCSPYPAHNVRPVVHHQQPLVQHQPIFKQQPATVPPTVEAQQENGKLNTGEYLPQILQNGNGDNERVEFQMHGFNGPNSYRFGYDTGKGANRQFRVEHSDKEGNVEGEYGFYGKDGKMNVVKYTSKGKEGFKTETIQP